MRSNDYFNRFHHPIERKEKSQKQWQEMLYKFNKIINVNHYHVGKVAITVDLVLISTDDRNLGILEKIGEAEKLDENN